MEDKFSAFSKRDIAYSSINGHDIFATVLTPTKLQDQPSAPRPVLVHWHGGGFVVGHRTYGPWWPLWTLELALSRSAIVISPDYRLLPEASGVDILTDVEAFWTWMQRELPLIAARESWPAYPDLSRVVVLGESSGGYLAVQSALLCSTKINIKAVISISAPLDGSATMRTMVPGPRMVMGARPPPPRQAQTLIRDYIRHGEPGVVRTEGDPLEMWTLLLSLLQQGWMPRLLGLSKDARLDPTKSLEGVNAIPPLWIIHSQADSVVPVACSSEFATAAAAKFPSVPLRLDLEVNGDHTFTSSMQMDTPWIQEGCNFISRFWN